MSAVVKLAVVGGNQVVLYDEMCRAIQASYDLDEVKHIMDKAAAIELYSRQAGNTEPERQACEVRLRAARRLGQLLTEMQKAKGGRPTNNPSPGSRGSLQQTLADTGISHNQSLKIPALGGCTRSQL